MFFPDITDKYHIFSRKLFSEHLHRFHNRIIMHHITFPNNRYGNHTILRKRATQTIRVLLSNHVQLHFRKISSQIRLYFRIHTPTPQITVDAFCFSIQPK